MGITEDVKRMREDGLNERQIAGALKERGFSPKQISDSLAQTKIKEAVIGAESELAVEAMANPNTEEFVPSMMVQEEEPAQATYAYQEQAYAPQPVPQAPAEAPAQNYAQAYPEQPQAYQQTQTYASYQPSVSSDTITEISEQVVIEKLSPLKSQLEKVLDLKTTLESRMEYLDERLKRIESIIDRLQLSVLQKVGEYVTNVEDLKKELIETQKSFKSLLPEVTKRRPSSVV